LPHPTDSVRISAYCRGRSGKQEAAKEEGYSDAFLTQYRILENLGIAIRFLATDPTAQIRPTEIPERTPDAVVDAVCGTGLEKELTGPAAAAVREMERLHTDGVYVLAADLPSGISATDGHVCGTAVHADDTVTFAFRKRGACVLSRDRILRPGRRTGYRHSGIRARQRRESCRLPVYHGCR
jgi:NAD(P)H-hydrate repair Nnr-like enzyme with NAD(P)H-hydrate epimerase domain